MMNQLPFIIFSFIAILMALGTITARNPVYSVLCLILTFFALSGHYVLLNAQFIAVVNLIVYAGAIMVLFLFVLMLLNLNKETEPAKSYLWQIGGAIAAGLVLVTLAGALKGASEFMVKGGPEATGIGLVKNLGKVLFTDFVVPFEISSILFLAAMVGAVFIGKREKQEGGSNA
jgi:NADH-quinone oxidoreductase subunit J